MDFAPFSEGNSKSAFGSLQLLNRSLVQESQQAQLILLEFHCVRRELEQDHRGIFLRAELDKEANVPLLTPERTIRPAHEKLGSGRLL